MSESERERKGVTDGEIVYLGLLFLEVFEYLRLDGDSCTLRLWLRLGRVVCVWFLVGVGAGWEREWEWGEG